MVKIGAGFSVFGFSACVGILQIKKFVVFLQACLGASLLTREMVHVAQLVRASDCGSEGRGFEPHPAPRRP